MYDERAIAVAERPRVGRPKKTVKTESTRIWETVLGDARTVAALRRIDVSDYLSELLAPLVARDLKAERKRIAKEED